MYHSDSKDYVDDALSLSNQVPDYDKLVANPIDLSAIRDKLDTLEYEDAFQFVDDVKLLFSNAKNYNEVRFDR